MRKMRESGGRNAGSGTEADARVQVNAYLRLRCENGNQSLPNNSQD